MTSLITLDMIITPFITIIIFISRYIIAAITSGRAYVHVPTVKLSSAIIKYPAVIAPTSISAPVLLSLFVINAMTAITITAIAATSCIIILVASASFVPKAANNVNAIYANTMIAARNTRLLALLYC